MESVPKTCDWVKVRHECSLDQMFILLSEVIDSDVKSMESRTKDVIALGKPAEKKLVVSRKWDIGGMMTSEAIVFEQTRDGISVKDARTEKHLFIAKPTVNQVGECKLEVDDQALELWQVSRKALEGLFFPAK